MITTIWERRLFRLYTKLNTSYSRLKEIQKEQYVPKDGPPILKSTDKDLIAYLIEKER